MSYPRHSLVLVLVGWCSLSIGGAANASPLASFGFISPLKGAAGDLPWYFEGLDFWIYSPDADIVSVDLATGNNGITVRFVQRWTSSN
jgi:hypothetical protein